MDEGIESRAGRIVELEAEQDVTSVRPSPAEDAGCDVATLEDPVRTRPPAHLLSAAMATTQTKRIVFYDFRAYGRKKRNQDAPEIALGPAFTAIKALPALSPTLNTQSRYVPTSNGQLLMEIFRNSKKQVRGGFAIKKSQDLPRLEKAGAWSDLTLEAEQGLAFIRHFIYWKDSALLGIEVNGNGPGLGALETYLLAQAGKALGFIRCEATAYLATDRFDMLLASDRISSASIGVKRDDISAISTIDTGLHDSLKSAAKSTNAQELRIEFLLGDRRADASLSLPFLKKLKSFVASPSTRTKLTQLKARARDMDLESMETVDLLEEKFVAREEVVISRNGVVDRTSMLDAIDTASNDLL